LQWHILNLNILDQINNRNIRNLKILDVGCGGGIICEPLARLGAKVTGIDFAPNNISAAKIHSKKNKLKINYIHKDVEKSCSWLKRVQENGLIKSWSLDLIQNLPLSGFKEWQDDLKKAIKFSPPHISIYDLNIENGTVFKKLINLGKLKLPSDEEAFRNSESTHLILKNSGYSRYEISNYCLPRHQSRHNRVYWSGLGWWSFGQGSTSSPWGEKFNRPRVSKEYKEWVIKQYERNLDSSLTNKEFVYKELDEKIMLGLRLKEGVDIKELFKEQNWENKKFESNFSKLLEEWKKFLDSGLLVRKGNRFFLSDPKGMELSNQVLVSMFKWCDEII